MNSSVYPSAFPRATSRVASVVLAPGFASTMTGCFHRSESFSPIARASRSTLPPDAVGMTIRDHARREFLLGERRREWESGEQDCCRREPAKNRSRTHDEFLRWFVFVIEPSIHLLKVKHQHRRLRARAADHHLLVFGVLVVGQVDVAMIGHAVDHPRLAGAAGALAAGVGHGNAGIEQGGENGLSRRDRRWCVRISQTNLEAALRRCFLLAARNTPDGPCASGLDRVAVLKASSIGSGPQQ